MPPSAGQLLTRSIQEAMEAEASVSRRPRTLTHMHADGRRESRFTRRSYTHVTTSTGHKTEPLAGHGARRVVSWHTSHAQADRRGRDMERGGWAGVVVEPIRSPPGDPPAPVDPNAPAGETPPAVDPTDPALYGAPHVAGTTTEGPSAAASVGDGSSVMEAEVVLEAEYVEAEESIPIEWTIAQIREAADAADNPLSIQEADLSTKGREAMAKKNVAMSDGSFPIPNVAFLRKAVKALGRANASRRPAVKAWIIKRARALGAVGALPDSWGIQEADGRQLGDVRAVLEGAFDELLHPRDHGKFAVKGGGEFSIHPTGSTFALHQRGGLVSPHPTRAAAEKAAKAAQGHLDRVGKMNHSHWDTGAPRSFSKVATGGAFARNSSVYVKTDEFHGLGIHGQDEGKLVAHSGTVVPLRKQAGKSGFLHDSIGSAARAGELPSQQNKTGTPATRKYDSIESAARAGALPSQAPGGEDPVKAAWKAGKTPSGDPLPAGLHHVDNLPVGSRAKSVNHLGQTSPHNPVYTKHADGSMRSPAGVKVNDPTLYLWRRQSGGGGKPLHSPRRGQRGLFGDQRLRQNWRNARIIEAVAEVLEARDSSAGDSHRNVKCPECDTVQSATHSKCSNCGHDLAGARKAKFASGVQEAEMSQEVSDAVAELLGAPVVEAADSMRKASTPEPFSTSRTSNWVARLGGLPDYIQHIAHDLMEKRGKSESNAIQMAIGIVKNPPKNWGAEARAAAAKAAAEWEAMKARNAGKRGAKLAVQQALFDALPAPDPREVIAEGEWLGGQPGELRRILEASTSKDDSGDGDKPKVFCVKDRMKVTPTDAGRCPKCGANLKPAMAKAA